MIELFLLALVFLYSSLLLLVLDLLSLSEAVIIFEYAELPLLLFVFRVFIILFISFLFYRAFYGFCKLFNWSTVFWATSFWSCSDFMLLSLVDFVIVNPIVYIHSSCLWNFIWIVIICICSCICNNTHQLLHLKL